MQFPIVNTLEMFTLLQGLWENYTLKPSINILIVGLDNAGKTTLLEQIKRLLAGKSKTDDLPETTPTIGLNVFKCEFDGIICQFWDLGGAGALQSLWTRYYPDCHAVFFVVDSSDEGRLLESRRVFETLISNNDTEGVPIAILANKRDLSTADISAIKEAFNPLMPLLEVRESKVFSVSAHTGVGIIEALEWLIKAVHNNSIHRPANPAR